MYRSFSIKNFRCFDELTVEGMGRINLIAGKNNVGKTALLEALWVHSSGIAEPERILLLDAARGAGAVNTDTTIDNLFFQFDQSLTIGLISNSVPNHGHRRLRITSQENPNHEIPLDASSGDQLSSITSASQRQIVIDCLDEYGRSYSSRAWWGGMVSLPTVRAVKDNMPAFQRTAAVFLYSRRRTDTTPEANLLSQLMIDGHEVGVAEILREIEPRLDRLTVVSLKERPEIYASIGLKKLVPLHLMGEGMTRILSLALAIATAPGGIVLVDEIENGIHHSVMEKVWKTIGAFARSYDVQLFATTHSYECIGAAYRAFEGDEEDELRLFRIERNREGKYKSVKFDRERIGRVIEFGMEVI